MLAALDAFSQDAFHFPFLLPVHYNGRRPEIALALVREGVVRGAFQDAYVEYVVDSWRGIQPIIIVGNHL